MVSELTPGDRVRDLLTPRRLRLGVESLPAQGGEMQILHAVRMPLRGRYSPEREGDPETEVLHILGGLGRPMSVREKLWDVEVMKGT